MTTRTVLFMDVDGVLIKGYNKNPALRRPWDADIQRDLGIDPNLLSRHFFQEKFLSVLKGKKELLPALEEALPDIHYKGKPQDIVEYWFKGDACVDLELLNNIQSLKEKTNINIYLATNQESMRAAYLWNVVGFHKHFDGMFYSAELGRIKEDTAFFTDINKRLSLNPKEDKILFFDDHDHYVQAACEAGWRAYLYEILSDFTENRDVKDMLKQGTD
jgi:putative hydrolase of the HAD superfamily